MKKVSFSYILIISFFFLTGNFVQAGNKSSYVRKIKKLIPDGSVILQSPSGKNLIQLNIDELKTPASIIKIAISYCLAENRGLEDRFVTDILINSNQDMLVKSYGDPFFVSEEIRLLAQHLKQNHDTKFRNLYFDTSAFKEVEIHGVNKSLNPYDALNGALVVNFNTMFLHKDKSGGVRTAEKQTPLTPLALEKARLIPVGKIERINFAGSRGESLRYAQELIETIFNEEGIQFKRSGNLQKEVNDWTLLTKYKSSKNLTFILKGMLKYSNNFTANQLLLFAAGKTFGFPADMHKAKDFLNQCMIKKVGLNKDTYYFEEASGISRNNRVSANAFIKILNKFKKYYQLLDQKKGIFLKSGTLSGVYNFAGYIRKDEKLYPFVIISEQKKNYRISILNILKKVVENHSL